MFPFFLYFRYSTNKIYSRHFLNFKVSHFARHFLFLSFGVAMERIQFTQFRCYISSLVHSVHHLFYFYPAVYDCWIHVNDSTPHVVSLNDESQLARRRQQSAGSAFQFHYMSLMSSSLLLQQCPAWIVFVMGGWWLYNYCFVGCCIPNLFNAAYSILA